MSRLHKLIGQGKKYLCTTGSRAPAYRCGDCVWHQHNNSIACLFSRKLDIHHITPLRELTDTL